ncbi:hypothetical protein ACHQM5_020333 [Ranunculus cassubicifolius]
MNYELAALKLLSSQLTKASPDPSASSFSLSGILFQRAWLQGILVSGSSQDGNFLLDDGTGVIQLSLSSDFLHRNWNIGMYVMVVGVYISGEPPTIKVYQLEINMCLMNVLECFYKGMVNEDEESSSC